MFSRSRIDRRKELYGDRKNPYPVNFSDAHGARPGFLAVSLLIAALLIHMMCCDWNPGPGRERARIVASIYAGDAFIYANQAGQPVYDTRKAALFGIAIPGCLAMAGMGMIGFLCFRGVAARLGQPPHRGPSPVPSDHLRARASRIPKP